MGAQNREAVESLADSIANDIKAGRWGDVLPVNTALIRELGSRALAALEVLQDRGVVVRGYVHGHATRRWVVTGTVPVFATVSEKVANAIEKKIESGQWRELPGHRSIAQEVHADPDTVTAALCKLQARGVVTKSAERTGSTNGCW